MTVWTGSTTAFVAALCVLAAWLLTGPIFHWSDTWQLIINTGTTIVTFLMVFLIQRAQNKDSLAIHIKLNELIAAKHGASNRLLNVEEFSEEDLRLLHDVYARLFTMARRDRDIGAAHSVEEAEERSAHKTPSRKNTLALRRKGSVPNR